MVKKLNTVTKPVTKTAAAAGAKARTAQPLRNEDEQSTDTLMQNFLNAKEALLTKLKAPGWKRVLCAGIVSLAVVVGISFLAGFAIDWLTLAALTLTGSAYVGLAIWLLGVICMAIACGKLAAMAWDAVITGRADEAATGAYNWVKGKLGFGNTEPALA